MDASEFSEDIDLLSVEGDMANMQSLESGKCVRIREDVGEEEKGIASEVGIFSVGHIDVKPGSNDCVPSVGMDIDIDIAAALLDLSRQVRIASSDAEKKPGPIAVKEERAVSVLIPDKGAEAEEEPTVAQDETPVLSASGDHQTNSNSSSSENIENQTMPIVEDVYMRREDGLETIQPVSESGNTSTESLGHVRPFSGLISIKSDSFMFSYITATISPLSLTIRKPSTLQMSCQVGLSLRYLLHYPFNV